jgi:hypothetical protein
MKIGYGWSQLSLWDTPKGDAYLKSKVVETPLSKDICTFILVNRVDQGDGYLRCEYVKVADITPETLKVAGEI